jgi:hypothetical protein
LNKILLTYILVLNSFYLNSQVNEYFKVEFDAFEPPIKEMINHAEGKPAKNFMIKDLNGNDIALSSYRGRKIVMWFWDESEASQLLVSIINKLAEKNKSTVFLGLYNANKASYLSQNQKTWNFTVLPNAEFIGEAIYDNELGTPRIYLIDEKSIVKMVLPTSFIKSMSNVNDIIENFVNNRLH